MQNDDILNTRITATFDISRDGYVIVKGLLYAIACIQGLPAEQRENGDMIAMCRLVRGMKNSVLFAHTQWGVESHVGREIDLWPAHGGDEPGGLYSDEELEVKEAMRGQITEWQERFKRTGAADHAPPSDVVRFLGGTTDQEPEAACWR